MNNENSFETFLYISKKKISILIWKNDTKDKLYENEFILKNESFNSELIQLEKFLSSNILQIEKYLKKFIKNIILIIDHEEPFKIKLSLKKKNYGNMLNDKSFFLSPLSIASETIISVYKRTFLLIKRKKYLS